jgi:protein FAM32A
MKKKKKKGKFRGSRTAMKYLCREDTLVPIRTRMRPTTLARATSTARQRSRDDVLHASASIMPGDEYTSFSGGGALKLKGAKVKKKKKTDKNNSDLEKALSTGEPSSRVEKEKEAAGDVEADKSVAKKRREEDEEEDEKSEERHNYKTEAERRFAEARRKKVSSF